MKIDKNRVGLTFGSFLAFLHLLWSILVALGVAQWWFNFVLNMHMVSMPIVVLPFNLVKALGLIIITFIVGYVFGWLSAFIWNKCFKEKISQ